MATSTEAPATRTLSPLRRFSRFIRFSALGATVVMPLTGAVTAAGDITLSTAVGLGLVGVAFHFYGYVLNDVVDLPIDRTEPRRAGSPLVDGTISRRAALAFSLANIPVAFALSVWIGASTAAHLALAVAIGLGAVYDVWGKRIRIPMVMDLVQGLAWASLGWYGAEIAGGATATTGLLAAFFVVYILMTNGVHASLRDLANDLRHGARTTAIAFGVVPTERGGARINRRLRAYAVTLQLTMVILSAAMLVRLDYEGGLAIYGTAAWMLLSVLAIWLLVAAIDATEDRPAMMVRGTLHLIVSLGVVIALLAPVMPEYLRVLAVAGYVGPLLTYGWLIDALRRVANPRSPG